MSARATGPKGVGPKGVGPKVAERVRIRTERARRQALEAVLTIEAALAARGVRS